MDERFWLRRAPLRLLALATLALAACSDPATEGPAAEAKDAAVAVDVAVTADAPPAVDTAPAVDAAADATPVAAKLTLKDVDPPQGRASGGETLTLNGTGFVEGMVVLIGGTPVDADQIFLIDDSQLQVQSPPHDTGLVDVEVVIPGDPAITAKLDDGFLYFNDLVITSIEPAEGPVAGGTPVTLHGSGFAGKTSVLIGGKPALGVQVLGDDEVTALTPPGGFGAANVHVVNERGAGLMKKGFFYFGPPSVTAVAPAAGPTAGGTIAIVSGQGFTKQSEVLIGTAKASVLEVTSTTKLKIATPPGPAGKAAVAVSTKHGTGVLDGGFVYSDDKGAAAAQILSIAPGTGPLAGGNQVAVIATGLVSASDTTVLFANKSAKIVSVAPASHTAVVVVPKGVAAGTVDVTLMTSKGSHKAAGAYAYSDALALGSVTPPAGPIDGGTKVVLKGSGFSKGKVVVSFGSLPAVAVAVVSDGEIQAVSPPGAAGYVAVTVQVGSEKTQLVNGFSYISKVLKLYVPFPNTGAQAGGTFVHLYGSGFTPGSKVTFAGQPATHFAFLDPSHITCKTPPGKVGAVDVAVQADGAYAVLPNGFTYFNPMSTYGGTWGAEVDGAINVTVLDSKSNKPVPDAFTMLWVDPTTPYQGFTNEDGQITFSGDDVAGKQMISASKESYESASVVLFDATNVTLHITPIPPPSPGSPPPGTPPPSVSGQVIGLDKYVLVPVGNCNQFLGSGPGATCNSCQTDAQCGTPDFACLDIGEGNGKRCVQDCTQTAACNAKFECRPVQGGVSRCVPVKGEKTAVCQHTKQTILSRDNYPPEGPGFEATPANGYNYKITTAFGEMAIVCFGGYKAFGAKLVAEDGQSMQAFTATVMGVRRHLMVTPEAKNDKVHIALTMPLTQVAHVRLDNPPNWPASGGFIMNAAWALLVFGADGVIRMPDQDAKIAGSTDADSMTITQLPAALAGDIHDASLSLIALVVQVEGQNQIPVTINVRNDIKELANDAMVRRKAGGDFETLDTGVKKNVYGMWGTSPKDLYAVGAQGTLVHWDGGGWSVQAAFTKEDLKAVHGSAKDDIWAVGNAGAVGHFDGLGWKPVATVGTPVNFNSVFAAPVPGGPSDVWAGSQQGIYRRGPTGMAKYSPSPFGNFLGMHGSDANHVWAVGMTGTIAYWNGSVWKAQSSGTSIALRSVWAAGPNSAYAVGEKGQILHWDGTAWKPMGSPVTKTLYAVHGSSDNDVWAVGGQGTVLRWDGKAWTSVPLKDVDKSLDALWLTAAGDFFAMGEQELLMTPLLYPPLDKMPSKGGILTGNTLKWTVDPNTTEPHFNYITIGIPGMGPDTPVWNIMTKGSLSEVELPDFPAIQGTPGIPKGPTLRLTIIRGYKEGFDIDAYDGSDLNSLTWRSWSTNQYFFTRQ